MMLRESDLAQRTVWILEALYGDSFPSSDAILAERVLTRLGSGAPDQWGKFQCSMDVMALLAVHARQVCHSERPGCGECELRKLCGRYRDEQRSRWEADSESPTVVDLFCGAGGASAGFASAGFKVLLAIDVDDQALLTYRLNHPELPEACVIKQDLSLLEDPSVSSAFRRQLLGLLGGRQVDVVVGGPPCQGFSQIGTRGRSSARSLQTSSVAPDGGDSGSAFKYDPKNRLYLYFLMIVEWLRPRFCVMENVPAMVRIGQGRVRSEVVQDYRHLGYHMLETRVYNAVDFGVPQTRERAIFLGCREASPLAFIVNPTSPVTLGDAIRDLPPLQAGTGFEVTTRTESHALTPLALGLSQGTRLVHNHVARPQMDSDLELYNRLKPGESIRQRPELRQDPYLFHYDNDNKFRDIYKRQNYDAPSSTVIAHLSKDGNMYIHPEQVRTYTVREAARVQTFPDDYIFCGSRTAQFRQVGNAIPPRFMRPFAEFIRKVLGYTEGDEAQVQARLPI